MWDVPYYAAKMKRQWLKFDAKDYCAYFSLGTCMDGINNLFNKLFSISLVAEPLCPGEVWHNTVYKLAGNLNECVIFIQFRSFHISKNYCVILVQHETEGLLGYIYCDFYERPEKPNQDCHYTIQGGRRLSDGSYQV